MHDDRPPRRTRQPRLFGLIPRERAYLAMMGVCLLLIVLAWTLIWRYSTLAAVVMSAVALVIPPVAVIIGNAGPVNRQ
jgi:Mg/Co/Ni transporter MgtE